LTGIAAILQNIQICNLLPQLKISEISAKKIPEKPLTMVAYFWPFAAHEVTMDCYPVQILSHLLFLSNSDFWFYSHCHAVGHVGSTKLSFSLLAFLGKFLIKIFLFLM
jgi:hypothetical protein